MTSDRHTWLIFGALAVSIVLSVTALIRIGDLRNEIEQLRGDASQSGHLQTQISDLERQLTGLAEDDGPIADMLWTIDDVSGIDCEGDVPITVSWSFRELPTGANVHLDIGREGHNGWVQIDAERTGDVDFIARHEVPLVEDLIYRVVAAGDQSILATEPQSADQLRYLTDQRILFEIGDSRSGDGRTWLRYFISPMTPLISPCNEIVSVTLTLHENGEPYETVELQRGYPGDTEPAGYEEDLHVDEAREARATGYAFDSTTDIPDGPHTPGEDDQWWSDWIELEAPAETVLEVGFGDGTTRTIEQTGIN